MDIAVKVFCFLLLQAYSVSCEEIHTTKVFMMTVGPWFFNWTDLELEDNANAPEFIYHLSLVGYPDLPSWMYYTYSERLGRGFLYGAPPLNQKDLEIQVIGVNVEDNEASSRVIQMNVTEKSDPALYEVCLKVDKLNVEDMLETDRYNQLLEIFEKVLWPDSQEDLYITYLAPAAHLGDRVPLTPVTGEGILIHLGSRAPFSERLLELEKEVAPLRSKGQINCPDFKHTSVERFFKQFNFSLDWCAFQLNEKNPEGSSAFYRTPKLKAPGLQMKGWQPISKQKVPIRHYVSELAVTVIGPLLCLALLVTLLFFILCFQQDIPDGTSGAVVGSIMVIFQNVLRKRDENLPHTELVQYEAVHRASNNLRLLSNQRDGEETETSPRVSLERTGVRHNPPPYTGVHYIINDDYVNDDYEKKEAIEGNEANESDESNETKTWLC